MAVTLTAAQLRAFLGGEPLTEERAGELLEVCKGRVEQYAPAAPAALQDEAVRRFAGYLELSERRSAFGVVRREDVGGSETRFVVNHSTAFRNSGAESLLTVYKERRAGRIPGS